MTVTRLDSAAVEIGTRLPEFRTPPLDPTRIRLFSEAMRDPNPVHIDPDFARSIGLPDVIAQGGVAVVALSHMVARWSHRDAIEEIDVKFRAPVVAYERLVCRGTVVAVENGRASVQCEALDESGGLRAAGTVWVRL
jgi:acyl dehydratase